MKAIQTSWKSETRVPRSKTSNCITFSKHSTKTQYPRLAQKRIQKTLSALKRKKETIFEFLAYAIANYGLSLELLPVQSTESSWKILKKAQLLRLVRKKTV